MTLPELNKARGFQYSISDKEEWPRIASSYSKRRRELVEISKTTGRVYLPTITPRVVLQEHPGTITDAMYDKESNTLVLLSDPNKAFKKGTTARQNAISITAKTDGSSITVAVSL